MNQDDNEEESESDQDQSQLEDEESVHGNLARLVGDQINTESSDTDYNPGPHDGQSSDSEIS